MKWSDFIVLNRKNSRITYEDFETIEFPINFFHDHTWFGPKISEMKILKFHDYNELSLNRFV